MDGVIGYSYTGLVNGQVVVIFGGSVYLIHIRGLFLYSLTVREYRNNPLIWMR